MSKNKTLSTAQRALLKLCTMPADGYEVEVVQQADYYAGTTEACRCAEDVSKESSSKASVIVAEANGAQAAIRQMCQASNVRGADMSARMSNVIEKLATRTEGDHQPVCLVFDEARYFKGTDIIKLLHVASYCANRLKISVRLIFIIGQEQIYNWKTRKYDRLDYPSMWRDDAFRKLYSPHARVWTFTQKSMTQAKPRRAWVNNEELEQPLLNEIEAIRKVG